MVLDIAYYEAPLFEKWLTSSCISAFNNLNRNFHSSQQLGFNFTPILCAEPLRKKKRIDPQILRERAEKKIRRLQRDIRRLEKVSRQFKPISELEVPRKAIRDNERHRPPAILTEAELKERAELKYLWAVYKRKQHLAEMAAIQRVSAAQERALDALQEVSQQLYEEALQPDPALIPFKMTGPVETPPIDDYDYPDGEFIDVTKVYQPIVPSDPQKQKKLGLHKKK
ncbi:39S ribosomal protein L40, mitochondrial-like isoform X2 [Argiope bruennichi]|uniref:39S ribosomal protein L40, mitochondrial-like isoform X2 n=1 Tax=Argiope bruennichi TaxID=94029 RepID=UPI002493E5CE|nr:39S ribosomal protein L40, mitochondrial-like isoform X2 [Argiope bruennichi]